MQRRTFLAGLIGILDGLIALGLVVPGVGAIFSPPRRRKSKADFFRVARLAALKPGEPYLASVEADHWDAYVHYPPSPVGRVWLIRDSSSGGVEQVRCLQTICPHLGCGIDFVPGRQAFSCPCHASEFSTDGKSLFGPSPRNMDELECKVGEEDENGQRWVEVRYKEFQPGTAQQSEV
jgi:Rieske Fe-S protein